MTQSHSRARTAISGVGAPSTKLCAAAITKPIAKPSGPMTKIRDSNIPVKRTAAIVTTRNAWKSSVPFNNSTLGHLQAHGDDRAEHDSHNKPDGHFPPPWRRRQLAPQPLEPRCASHS